MKWTRAAAVIILILLNCLAICGQAWCQEQIYSGKREKATMQIPRAYTASVPQALKFMEDQFTRSGSRKSGDKYIYVRKVSYVNLKSIEDRMAELISRMKTVDLFITIDYAYQQIHERYGSSSSPRYRDYWEIQICWIDAADMTSSPEKKTYHITSVTAKYVRINAGARDGLKKGDTIEIVKKDAVIGTARIEEISNSSAQALIIELKERSVSAGNSVRLPQSEGITAETAEEIKKDNVASIKAALQKDAGLITKCDNQGRTLLHLAAYHGSREVTLLLISSGADVNAKDSAGMTPLQYAEGRGNKDIADILRSKGQK